MFKLATCTCRSSSRIHFGTFVFSDRYLWFLNGLTSNVKLFPDDASLFSVVKNKGEGASDLINDLDMISKLAYNWEISFNPDPKKPAWEVLFSRKNSNITHPVIYFTNVQVQRDNQQRHLGIILDEKLIFKSHIDKVLTKTSKSIAVIKRFRNFLPSKLLVTIYKAIIRPHLDYGDIPYDQPNNAIFCQKVDSLQYKTALSITSAIQGTSQKKYLEELGLGTLKSCRWLRVFCCMYKIKDIGILK